MTASIPASASPLPSLAVSAPTSGDRSSLPGANAAPGADFSTLLPVATAPSPRAALASAGLLLSATSGPRETGAFSPGSTATGPAKSAAGLKAGQATKEVGRDTVESIAALLAPMLQSLTRPEPVPAAGNTATESPRVAPAGAGQGGAASLLPDSIPAPPATLPGAQSVLPGAGTGNPEAAGDTPPAAEPQSAVTIDFGSGIPAVAVPWANVANSAADGAGIELRQSAAAAVRTALARAGIPVNPASGSKSGGLPAAPGADTGRPPISITVDVPQLAMTVSGPDAATAANQTMAATGAKIAVAPDRISPTGEAPEDDTEKHFLTAHANGVTTGGNSTGIGVAQTGANMSASFNPRRNAASLPDPNLPILLREVSPVAAGAGHVSPDLASSGTPAPLLAHRAVETVLNVLDAQSSPTGGSGQVNLHFKFGPDDLSVRVQLRGGEVHTQFNTDSNELRSALSTEWKTMTAAASAPGLRLAEPVFGSSSSGADHGFGSSPQGQNFSQQHTPPQTPAPAVFPGLRALSGGAVASTGEPDAGSSPVTVPAPNSRHLAAVA